MKTGYIYKHDTKQVGSVLQSCDQKIIEELYEQYISDKKDMLLTYKREDFLLFTSCTNIFQATRINGTIKVTLNGQPVELERS